ncbi:hydroxysqualene dehydroxylase [Bradymonas sediminis]|uniref:Phytoene dehydrogenase n=1 Tax=Bradymonas sediminis TaxID=1548548 RepID=A0A2Z4FJ10_9DELT|nr:FAD-dependent oxidoreductase [Bradymonas sediminis]AWV88830.1 phytoene dehydrogenase [Bradymonas sediminis]TDP71832.1 uncharacterized protein with NAD-binding domain and iron-sulfur cluster [Bradymonas sediminis]
MSQSVAIFGGGVAGLTAAHELIERGYRVSVYERRDIYGGKARSMGIGEPGVDGRHPLPGEHGFRFFPSFYRHLQDTMKRIPFGDNPKGVYDNLVATKQVLIARAGAAEIQLPANLPDSMGDWINVFRVMFGDMLGIPRHEILFFIDRMLQILCACEERRLDEYEQIPWWDFIEADTKSTEYQNLLGRGLTRSLVAMQAEKSSTRTVGVIYLQLVFGVAAPWLDADRLLDGPTNDVWIDPWVQYLTQLGVNFCPETTIEAFDCDGEEITGVRANGPNGTFEVSADYYIAALPVEAMIDLVTPIMKEGAPSLANLDLLETSWMNGIQYFLDRDVPLAHGHGIFIHSEWALTTVSQGQFWKDVDLSRYGDGRVDGILSVCISDWDTPGLLYGKPASQCSPQEIKDEVWAQLEVHINDSARPILHEANILDWHLDPAISYPDPGSPDAAVNAEPLLINTVGSWEHRPEAVTGLDNFFVASDYVRTNTDLATMEGANESARRAVNGILERGNSRERRCKIWTLDEPPIFAPMRVYDRLRYEMGLGQAGR